MDRFSPEVGVADTEIDFPLVVSVALFLECVRGLVLSFTFNVVG